LNVVQQNSTSDSSPEYVQLKAERQKQQLLNDQKDKENYLFKRNQCVVKKDCAARK